MAEAGGKDGIHSVTGLCDLCGEHCDPQVQELNSLACSFAGCEGLIYHQDCLEKYLKSIRCEKNRKTGFKCPRGCGKGSRFSEPCKGKIEKSHPIHPRNEESKLKKKVPDMVLLPAKPQPVAKKDKDKAQEELQKLKPAKAEAKTALLGKAAATKSTTNGLAVLHKLAAAKTSAPEPVRLTVQRSAKVSTAMPTKEQILARVAAERKALGVSSTFDSTMGFKQEDSRTVKDSRTAAAPGLNPWNKALQPQSTGLHDIMDDFPVPRQPVVRTVRPAPPAAPQPLSQPAAPVLPACQARPSGANASAVAGNEPERSVNGLLPVGMDYLDDQDGQKLTRAQRKNLRRAEKKKLEKCSMAADEASAPSMSIVSTEDQEALIESKEEEETVASLFIECLISHKVMNAFKGLQQFGFPDWQCAAAVRRHGTALEAAVEWLLDGNVDAMEDLEASLPAVPEVDISDELEYLASIQSAMGLDNTVVQWEVINESGDVGRAVANLMAHLPSEASGGEQGGLTPSASVYSSMNGVAQRHCNGSDEMSTSVDSEDLMGLLGAGISGQLSYDGTTTANADLFMDMMAHKSTGGEHMQQQQQQQQHVRQQLPAAAAAPLYHTPMQVSAASHATFAGWAPPVAAPAANGHHHAMPVPVPVPSADLSGLNARQDPVEQWTPRGKNASLIGLNRIGSNGLINGSASQHASYNNLQQNGTLDYGTQQQQQQAGGLFRSNSFNDNGIEDYRRLLLGDSGDGGNEYGSGALPSVASGFSLFGKEGEAQHVDVQGQGMWSQAGVLGKGLMGMQHGWGLQMGGHEHFPEAALYHAANVTTETEESDISALMATLVCK